MQRYWLLAVLLVFVTGLSAQQQNSLWERGVIEVSYHPGIVAPHHNSIRYFINEPVQGVDINIGFRCDGAKQYHKYYRYPVNGLGFYYTSLGNDSVYGNALATYAFAKIPFKLKSDVFKIEYRAALGLSYLTKIFDVNDNYRNFAIGSHVNVYARTSLRFTYKPVNRFDFFADAGFIHMSNGLIKSPNYGLNLFTLAGGVAYNLSSEVSIKEPEEISFDKNHFSVFLSGGIKTQNDFENKREPVASISASYERKVSHKRMFGGGLDVFYDKTMYKTLQENGFNNVKPYQLYRLGVHGLHEVLYGRVAVTMQLGYYVYSEYEELTKVYSRLGVRYNIYKNIWGSVAIKAHYAVADFIEWGIGYRW